MITRLWNRGCAGKMVLGIVVFIVFTLVSSIFHPTPAPTKLAALPTVTSIPTVAAAPTPVSTPEPAATVLPKAIAELAAPDATDEPAPTDEPVVEAAAAPAPAASVAQSDDSAPCAVGQFKGNDRSHIFHAPGQRDYAKTHASVTCFDTAAQAKAAGYRAAKR